MDNRARYAVGLFGVTQPYVFNFFENKEELFKTVIERSFSRIYDTFSEVKATAYQLIQTMGSGFKLIDK